MTAKTTAKTAKRADLRDALIKEARALLKKHPLAEARAILRGKYDQRTVNDDLLRRVVGEASRPAPEDVTDETLVGVALAAAALGVPAGRVMRLAVQGSITGAEKKAGRWLFTLGAARAALATSGGAATRWVTLPGGGRSRRVDTKLQEAVKQAHAAGRLAQLPDEQREVLERRYGLTGKPPESLREIGKAIGKSGESVRHMEARALSALYPEQYPVGTKA